MEVVYEVFVDVEPMAQSRSRVRIFPPKGHKRLLPELVDGIKKALHASKETPWEVEGILENALLRLRGIDINAVARPQIYEDTKMQRYRDYLAMRLRGKGPDNLIEDSYVKVELIFYLTRPKSVPKKKRPYPWVKPDGDNLEKATLDAMEDAGWFKDQTVIKGGWEKCYDDEHPKGIKIQVTHEK